MERRIYIKPLQKHFTVSIKDANRQKRNRSYSNASNCCGARIQQQKLCSNCQTVVDGTSCERKIVKIGKEEHLMNAHALKQVTETLAANEDITIHTFLETIPVEAQDRFDSLVYALPAKKHGTAYAELSELMRNTYGVGTAVFRNNEYEVIIHTGADGIVRIRKLIEETQRYDMPSVELSESAQPNAEILALEQQLIRKHTKDNYDFTAFRDTRSEIEDKLIEDVVLHGKQPEPTSVQETAQEQSNETELERLKALMSE